MFGRELRCGFVEQAVEHVLGVLLFDLFRIIATGSEDVLRHSAHASHLSERSEYTQLLMQMQLKKPHAWESTGQEWWFVQLKMHEND